MKKILFTVTLMSLGIGAIAQDFVDNALLFSRTRPTGSARIQALGGTQVSLGGDYSSAFSNPAGLGMYNRSEFTISPGLTMSDISSTYQGNKTSGSKSMLTIPGLSFVYHHESGQQSGFLGGSFGLSVTRTNDFNREFRYRGTNSDNSIIDYFIDDAYGVNPQTFLWRQNEEPGANFRSLTAMAYNNFLIEDYQENGRYMYRSVLSPLPEEPGFPAEIRTIDQEEVGTSKGSQYQWNISYGANFNDNLFVGATLGITSIRYKISQIFRESNFRYSEDPDYQPIDNFETNENYDIRGNGVNFTIGAIYRPLDFLQIGASLVTPTFYGMDDTYGGRITSLWNYYDDPDNPSFPEQPDVTEYFDDIPLISEYNIITPMRVTTGATFISKFGFISADVEFVNYSKAKYDSDIAGDFNFENDDIKSAYKSVVNYRVGAEYRHDIFRVRAGYNYMTDPHRNTGGLDRSIKSISGGLGVKMDRFFADLGAVFSSTEGSRSPYFSSIGPDPVALQKLKNASYILTLGFTF